MTGRQYRLVTVEDIEVSAERGDDLTELLMRAIANGQNDRADEIARLIEDRQADDS